MYRIIDKRGTGKTARLMLLAKETGATIVCINPRAMRVKAQAYGFNDLDFCSYEEFCKNIKSNNFTVADSNKVLIDEIECLFNYMSNNKIIGYSLSLED